MLWLQGRMIVWKYEGAAGRLSFRLIGPCCERESVRLNLSVQAADSPDPLFVQLRRRISAGSGSRRAWVLDRFGWAGRIWGWSIAAKAPV